MEENVSREELAQKLASIEERLKSIRETAELSGTPISMAELIALENERDAIKESLDNLIRKVHTQEVKREEEHEEQQNKSEITEQGNPHTSEIQNSQAASTENIEVEIEEQKDEAEKTDNEHGLDERDEEVDNREDKRTLHDWEKLSGTHLLADKYTLNKYDKYLSENDFRNIIATENDAVIITDGALNEAFFRDASDKSSKSAINNAMRDGNIPVENSGRNYINVANGGGMDGRVYDNDNDGMLDTDDFRNDALVEKGIDVEALEESLGKTISNVTSSELASVTKTLDNHAKDPEQAKRDLEEVEKTDDDEFAPTPPRIV